MVHTRQSQISLHNNMAVLNIYLDFSLQKDQSCLYYDWFYITQTFFAKRTPNTWWTVAENKLWKSYLNDKPAGKYVDHIQNLATLTA